MKLTSIAAAAAIGAMVMTPSLFAQESAAGQQIHESGQSAKSATSNAGASVKQAYHATTDELGDAALTTKVKTALKEAKTTKSYTIHVKSDQGVVKLSGVVGSRSIAQDAAQVASRVSGVRSVDNQLTWPTS